MTFVRQLFTLVGLVGLTTATALGNEKIAEQAFSGDLVCTKCTLKEEGAKKCQLVLNVKDGETTQRYYIVKNKAEKEIEETICSEGQKSVTATGTVSEKGEKKWLTASKIAAKDTK